MAQGHRNRIFVALRKESVDRNVKILVKSHGNNRSLSARRAWIEIGMSVASNFKYPVALRKESVDRNWLLAP